MRDNIAKPRPASSPGLVWSGNNRYTRRPGNKDDSNPMRSLPNILSALRLALVPLIGWCVLTGRFTGAGLLFAVAAITDGLDGHLARRLGAESALGAALDPIADKMLIGVVTLACASHGLLPIWFAALVVTRDVLILAAAMLIRARRAGTPTPPLPLGKASTAAQMLLLAAVLIPLPAPVAALAPIPVLTTLAAVLTIVSATAYCALLRHGSTTRINEISSPSRTRVPSAIVTPPTIGEAETRR